MRKWDLVWSIGVTALVSTIAWLIDYFLPVESYCNIVYMVPAKAESSNSSEENGIVVDGCKLFERQVLCKNLDAYLKKEQMIEIACPVLAESEKEWILHAAPENALLADAADDSARQAAVKKKRLNTIASALARSSVRGRAVVVPMHRDWRPTIMGRIDMLTGMYKQRKEAEEVVKVVTRDRVIQIYKDAQVTSETMVTEVERKAAEIHKTLTGRSATTDDQEADTSAPIADE